MNSKAKIIIVIAATILFISLINSRYQNNSHKNFINTMKIGDDIVVALNKYHKDNGNYPEELSQLVPKYLKKISNPTWGKKIWLYEKYDTNENVFWLAVRMDNTNRAPLYYKIFSDGSGTWYFDDDAGPDSWRYD